MDRYLIGETLFEGITVYTPWFSKRGNAAVFAVDIMGISGLTMTLTIETKKRDDWVIKTGRGTVRWNSDYSA